MLCDLYEEILCGMENSQDFLPFFDVALQQTLILLCTVHVNIKLKGGFSEHNAATKFYIL